MKNGKSKDFAHYMNRVKKEDPDAYKGIEEEILKLRLSLKLRNLREKLHKTQSEVAKEAHTSQAAVARYENDGYAAYELTTLWRLAQALNAELLVDFKPRHRKIA